MSGGRVRRLSYATVEAALRVCDYDSAIRARAQRRSVA